MLPHGGRGGATPASRDLVEGIRFFRGLKEFLSLDPPTFTGALNPIVAKDWLEQTTKALDVLGIGDDNLRVLIASYQFTGEAEVWWESVTSTHMVEGMDWGIFLGLFHEKYLPISVMNALRDEFLALVQGNMNVEEYEDRFTSLSRFAPDIVADESTKTRQFA
ncbi:uncharacterized protein LOC132314327 [Cornus florida]|uniref:uncharacterized protein LOC132314327 n=1 Tax=Cornus florida TaxID=4283 RepID=UPI00289A881E|nr:uncharacterized protein LOC132314327 [Cornus florida]